MKRQCAFDGNSKLLKGALHCHTTRSDGQCTPEYALQLHLENGYDFVALTDHRRYNFENYGNSPLTIIPGMELDSNFVHEGGPFGGHHCHHIVCLGPRKEKGNGFEHDQTFNRYYIHSPEETQPILDMVHQKKNLTIYAHPMWSGTPASDFKMLQGNFAMEIWNSGVVMDQGYDNNAAYWDELLAEGQRIFGVATDDGHKVIDHCNGWVRVNAPNNVEEILGALEKGAFYSSCGPEIYDFYVEDGMVHVKCSPVAEINLRHMRVPYRMVSAKPGEAITEAKFKLIRGAGAMYVRAEAKDHQGRRAWTNPIFLDEDDYR